LDIFLHNFLDSLLFLDYTYYRNEGSYQLPSRISILPYSREILPYMGREIKLKPHNVLYFDDLVKRSRMVVLPPPYDVTYFYTFIDTYELERAESQLSSRGRRTLHALRRRIDRTRGNVVTTCITELKIATHLSTDMMYDSIGDLKKLGFIRKGRRLGKKRYEIILNPYWYWCGYMQGDTSDLMKARKEWDLLVKGEKVIHE